jgi:hypothetical protein
MLQQSSWKPLDFDRGAGARDDQSTDSHLRCPLPVQAIDNVSNIRSCTCGKILQTPNSSCLIKCITVQWVAISLQHHICKSSELALQSEPTFLHK